MVQGGSAFSASNPSEAELSKESGPRRRVSPPRGSHRAWAPPRRKIVCLPPPSAPEPPGYPGHVPVAKQSASLHPQRRSLRVSLPTQKAAVAPPGHTVASAGCIDARRGAFPLRDAFRAWMMEGGAATPPPHERKSLTLWGVDYLDIRWLQFPAENWSRGRGNLDLESLLTFE